MGYFYAAVSAAALTLLGVSYKLSDRMGCDQRQVNFFFLFFGAVMAAGWGIISRSLAWKPSAVFLGAGMGLAVFIAVVAFRAAAHKGRIAVSWTILNLSLVLPVAASILVWHEIPSPKHWIGLALTLGAIVLLGTDMARAGE